MKRTFLAVLLACAAFAFARADEGAYDSLIGMAQSAKTDRGPDAGSLPDRAADGEGKTPASCGKEPKTHELPASGAPIEAGAGLKDAVAQPPAPKPRPRLLTRLYATLRPSWRKTPSLASEFEPAVSTAAVRLLPPLSALMPPPDSEAVKAGERRGLAELMSASSAPTSGQ